MSIANTADHTITNFRLSRRVAGGLAHVVAVFLFTDGTFDTHQVYVPVAIQCKPMSLLLRILHLVGNKIDNVKSITCTDLFDLIPFMSPAKVYDDRDSVFLQYKEKYKKHLPVCKCYAIHENASYIRSQLASSSGHISWMDADSD